MADDGETTTYEWFLYLIRKLVQWSAFVLGGCGTLLIFWFHWGNAYSEYGVKWFEEKTAGDCVGQSLPTYGAVWRSLGFSRENFPPSGSYCELDTTTWCGIPCNAAGSDNTCAEEPALSNGGAAGFTCSATSDNNVAWRKLFTLKPNDGLDTFTPIVLGAVEVMQHISPDYRKPFISGTWIVRSLWLFFVSLFSQFGYAGDLGVLLGYFLIVAGVIPCVALAILDHESDEEGNSVTTADVLPGIKWLLELCGLDGLCPGLATVKGTVITKDDAQADESGVA